MYEFQDLWYNIYRSKRTGQLNNLSALEKRSYLRRGLTGFSFLLPKIEIRKEQGK